jgi:DNA-binding transcriptional LysR family regulator
MIDLDALVALGAVDRQGSVISAAATLGYTPSAVSQQIKRLERQTGVALLERVGRGVIVTSQGRQLIDHGTRLLADIEEIESELHRSAIAVAGHLRLVAFSTAMRGLVVRALPPLSAAHPELRLDVSEGEPWETIDLVATGRCDIGVVHSWGDEQLPVPDHLQSVVIARDIADVLVPRDHRLARRKKVSPRDLLAEGWVATPPGTICRQWLETMYAAIDHTPRITYEAAEFETHIAFVAARLGIALVPRLGRAPLPESVVALAAHDPESTRQISVVHRRTAARSPAIQATIAALRSAAEPTRERSTSASGQAT